MSLWGLPGSAASEAASPAFPESVRHLILSFSSEISLHWLLLHLRTLTGEGGRGLKWGPGIVSLR